ncbi:unnamed protein product [Phaeothamnion confervicola]
MSTQAGVNVMVMRQTTALLFALATTVASANAQDFQIVKVASVSGSAVDQLKSKTIFFNDYRADETSDKGAFMHFDEWTRTKPVQKQFLSLFPAYSEGMIHKVIDGSKKEVKDELSMYVTEARFSLSRPATSIDLKSFANLNFIQSIDPAIKHQIIQPSDISMMKDEKGVNNKNPDRNWCEGTGVVNCTRSTYKLEGKLPVGIALANKLRDSDKKVSDTIEFESELRLLAPADIDQAGIKKLTGVDTPVAAVLEQNMFYVNQIMRFGKLVAVFQQNPADEKSTVATVMIALAVSTSTLESKKKYQDVPVLRNLVPAQVLLGNSSFNTGNSISSGLPNYVRNRIKAIAALLDKAA